MALRRYARSPVIRGGLQYGTSSAARIIRDAVNQGQLATDVFTLQQGERLDVLAGKFYGDGRLWWVIAAASGIGWGAQVPAGTRLLIPRDIAAVSELVG